MSAPVHGLEIGLLPGERTGEPRAALLPGGDPAAWLESLAAWDRPLGGLSLWPLPGLAGALLPLPRGARDLPPRAVPLALRGERLFLPLDARLVPDLADEELVELLGREAALLHPSLGLLRLPRASLVGLTELVALPPARPSRWRAPPAAGAPLPRLLRVEPAEPPSLDALFEQERRSVAEPPPSRPEPRPEGGAERGGAAGDAGAEAGAPAGEGWLRRAWRKLSGRLQGGGAKAPPERAAPEAERDPEPGDGRERELDRLLRLLAEDPDRGLRHALPLAGAPEGQPPKEPPPREARLPEREPSFALEPPGQGAAWVVSADLHLKLARRYRELAERELALGRPRRAAWVYWQLLGDARAAAQALEQGGHHREAADLWRRRLRQGPEAARCLERGGHYQEAAELWEAEGELERAGDLHQRIGREEEARDLWRRAVESLRAGGDPCGAARLLETKLGAPDQALALLGAGWPGGAQARDCLRGELFLLGRLGRHAEARRRIDRLLEDEPPRWRELALAEVLLDAARRYPDGAVRERAKDGVRVVSGAALPRASAREAESLVRLVTSLDPEDRLLGRDARRYLAAVRRRAAALEVRTGPMREAKKLREIALPRNVTWDAACAGGDGFWAAGRAATGPVALRGRWDGRHQQVVWSSGQELEGELMLLPPAGPSAPALIAARGGGRLPLCRFARDEALGPAVNISTPGWIPEGLRAWSLVHGAGVAWLLHGNAHGLVLSAHYPDAAGRVLQSDVVATDAREAETAHVVQAPRGPVWLAIGRRLERREGRRVLSTLELDGPIQGLAIAPARPVLAAALEEGLVLCLSRGGGRVDEVPLARELRHPHMTFTGDGRLVVVGANEGRVYDVNGEQPVLRASFPGPGKGVIAAIPLPAPRQVAFVTKAGWVRVYELPLS